MRICCDGKTVGLDFQLLQFSKESRWACLASSFTYSDLGNSYTEAQPLPVEIACE